MVERTKEKKQFVRSINKYSSQYGKYNSISYVACNLKGPTTVYPSYGDFTQTCVFRTYGQWWYQSPSAYKPFGRTPPSFVSEDFVEVVFSIPVFPKKIEIYETYCPGAVVKILAYNTSRGTNIDTGQGIWEELWSGVPVRTLKPEACVFSPPIKRINFATNLLRIEFCHIHLGYYTELDAVCLYGTGEPYQLEMPDQEENSISSLSLGENDRTISADKFNYFFSNGHCQEKRICGGYFSLLPEEVIYLILSYLDLPSLCQVSQTCRLLKSNSYDHLQWTEVNLKPFWHKVNDGTLISLKSRCSKLQKLNLSWCGTNCSLLNCTFDGFLSACGQTLTCLYLACCDFVDDLSLDIICNKCPNIQELDLQHCKRIKSPGVWCLGNLKSLERLNLYHTKVCVYVLEPVFRNCEDMKFLNLGSCMKINNIDSLIVMKAFAFKNLEAVDFWRSSSLSGTALKMLARKCPYLKELDLGWCCELKSSTNCFVEVVQKCLHLKKLFLTANRSVCDADLKAFAKYGCHLEQLDILGTREVTEEAVYMVLKNCHKLRLFDISFCTNIESGTVYFWRQEFPGIDIKQSFQPENQPSSMS